MFLWQKIEFGTRIALFLHISASRFILTDFQKNLLSSYQY